MITQADLRYLSGADPRTRGAQIVELCDEGAHDQRETAEHSDRRDARADQGRPDGTAAVRCDQLTAAHTTLPSFVGTAPHEAAVACTSGSPRPRSSSDA